MHPTTRSLAASLLAAATLFTLTAWSGSARADEDVRAWQEDADEEPPPRYGPGGEREPARSSGDGGAMLGFGIALTALGGLGILGGGLLVASCVVPETDCDSGPAAGALAGAGALGLLVGIPLIVIGKRKRNGVALHDGVRLHAVALPAGDRGLGPGGGGLSLSGSF